MLETHNSVYFLGMMYTKLLGNVHNHEDSIHKGKDRHNKIQISESLKDTKINSCLTEAMASPKALHRLPVAA
jgi:hypothetical protein